jgi:hypothetical protein
MRFIFGILLLSTFALAQTTRPALDGATITLEQDGRSERYRLVADRDNGPAGVDKIDRATFDLTLVEAVAPALVTVHAMNLVHDPLTTRYEWDFGDPKSKRNRLPGFAAGHVYDVPGEYVVTLRITTSDQKSTELRRTVRIEADDRPAVHVSSSSGDDANAGSIDKPLKSLAAVGAKYDRDVRILLKRGDTFDTPGPFLSPKRRVLVGAYGDNPSPKPVIRYTGTNTSDALIRCSNDTAGLVVENIAFDSILGSDPGANFLPHCIVAGGKQIVVRDVTFLNVSYAINGNAKPAGMMIERCDVPRVDGLRRYLAWIEGTDWTILDNTVPNSTYEHCIRGREFDRVLIAHNELSNIARPEANDIAKKTINLQAGERVYVAHNTLRGPSSIGPLGRGDGLKIKEDRSRCYVVENNTFIGAPFEVHHGIADVMIRGNRFEVDGSRCVIVEGFSTQYGRGTSNITIADNTAANAGTAGGFLLVTGKVDGITLVRNTYTAPALRPGVGQAANVYVADADLSSFRLIEGNTWSRGKPTGFAEGGAMYVWPTWSDKRGYLDPTEWAADAKVKRDSFK